MSEDRIALFQRAMLKLFVTLPHRDTSDLGVELRSEAYFEALEPYTGDEIGAAVRAAIAEPGRVFPPTPGELIEIIQEARRERRRRDERERQGERMVAAVPVSDEDRAAIKTMLDELNAKLHWRWHP